MTFLRRLEANLDFLLDPFPPPSAAGGSPASAASPRSSRVTTREPARSRRGVSTWAISPSSLLTTNSRALVCERPERSRLGSALGPRLPHLRSRWYHDNLTRHAAEALLLSNGQDGSYLLRKSNEREDLYSLSVRGKDSVKHFHVEHTGTSFKFGFNEFSSLKELVMHFANQPLIGSETGTLIVLKHPYPREVEEPSIYESVRVHTAMQTGRTESDLVPNAPSNWKTRWFTLHRNELKYFKDQTATEPIRALDLTECSAVQFDYSQERVNCFCLVFPLRTYYLCAKTGIEADEWIKILRWKLSQIRKQLEERNATLSS
ncbi:dual adapter for phosphotyrosine and 3-phosphotyrosine and 3-phosphoinositide isoform X2 [Corvus hawaiiensis]|uniref:dual adapter for phosphotyrosine and 3-phosphotyrosine and 3-phosphoinositide isoform X2 n=1 Tax=Corvus moneduloides TaxID=1196302 RepID=UPI0013631C56|nr:dual adapter for phosphotyrosine and 3-phosphotyrosine and 3-phosphoinositide isoform X2 [Corvus moneduloides]XP_041905680.1 dual adapter for phosphotyrosine and 3-phosphotyrosine and 3-phosphoinositide isoform X2 [Corvus kubaryi]XP_048159767.1 dual adapter for phosphotyrosine and 3-phosphotyrosine and 3-phosphoinositide isoform X2 [Corvus hawaiiensis]